MKISAVIPAYSAERYIARSIQSVLAQTRPVDELIIVDDCSTDGTLASARSPIDDRPNMHVVFRPTNGDGAGAARNMGVRLASGEWIAFLDADDEWAAEFLAEVEGLIERAPPDMGLSSPAIRTSS